jgi:hypothetical protein
MNTVKRQSKKGGYIADYNKVSTPTDYIIYVPPAADTTTSSSEGAVLVSTASTPGMTKGGRRGYNRRNKVDNVELANDFYYSIEGGCALCNTGGCGNKVGGSNPKKSLKGGFGLEPFITALALLGARMLADKEVGLFNGKTKKSSRNDDEEDED